MQIGIIGVGNVGGTIGVQLANAGYPVVFGVRSRDDPKVQARIAATQGQASARSIGEAIHSSDVVVFAVPGSAVDQLLGEHGPSLGRKLVIDATNRVGSATLHSVPTIQAHAPDTTIYRAFNTLGWEMFANPQVGGQQADLFFCGPAAQRSTVEQLIAAVGPHPVYLGDNDQLATLDMLAQLWFTLAFKQGYGRRVALKVLTD